MVYCSNCGTANRDGSSFCNDCGAKLPSGTSVRCPQCGTPNSPTNIFCEKCGARLVPTLADDTPESEPPAVPLKKGLSLPTKPDPEASPAANDWLGQLRSSLDSSAVEEPASPEETVITPTATSAKSDTAAGDVPDWLTSLGIIAPSEDQPAAAADEDVPEWLSQLPLTAEEPTTESEPADASTGSPADWLSNLRELSTDAAATDTSDSAMADEDVPEWLRALGTGPLPPNPIEQATASANSLNVPRPPILPADTTSDEEEVPDWLRSLGTGPLPSATVEPISPSPAVSIKPESPSQEPAAAHPPADQPAAPEELPDWLRNLSAADHTQRSTDELPDWLDTLGSEAAQEPGAADAGASDDDVPAWLRDLGASAVTQPVEPAAESDSSANDTVDWMSSLRATTTQPEESAESVSEPAADQTSAPTTDETADWLSSLRATTSEPDVSVESAEQSATDEAPDWLQAMDLQASSEPEEVPTAPAAEDNSDWMSSLRATASQPEEPAEPAEEPTTDEVPDWLQTMGLPTSKAEPIIPAADETSDWLSSLRATASQPEESAEPTEGPAADEVPDWLQAMGSPDIEEKPATSAADETSDWMSSLRATASQPEEPAKPTEEAATTDEVPDWLQAMQTPASGQTVAPAIETETANPVNQPSDDEVPDWLRDFGSAELQPAVSSEQPADEVPVGLRTFEAPASQTAEQSPAAAQPQTEDVPDWLRDAGLTMTDQPAPVKPEELPDWLRDAQPADVETTEEPVAETPAPTESVEPVAELPEWLSNLQTPAAAEPATSKPTESASASVALPATPSQTQHLDETPEQVVLPAELPDWLKSLREGKPAAPVSGAEPLPGLTQAEIPSWLEALRPKEGQASAVTELPAESEEEGVFAGLANILPVSPDLNETPAATVHEITGPSADDLARAGIFQELLTRPASRPTPVAALPLSGRQTQRRLLQWAITLLLAAVIIAPFLMPQGWLPILPHADNLPPTPLVQSAVTKIAVLPPNANVLVVFDYDPTQAGEMNQIAEIVLRHLQTRAANVTAVSLNPLGTELAESLWHRLGDSAGGQRRNLGYVPGQAIGVQNILLNSGPFALVVDLSASSDSVRWWAEQIAVNGFNLPLIAGVSASAESLALPYAQSRQVVGLISGAAGAMMYARQANLLPSLEEAQQAMLIADQTGQPPSQEVVLMVRNQYHIESQTLAHWLLAVLIVIGLVSGLVSRAGRRSAS